ncbi:alpha/beta hydrolase [Cryobacterium sp. TMT4-31]|uniref:alpha/beta hydrolase n=1 Tax=Cryobacterium sp. TMT4-31 TaxID=1259259 RepID=UPI00106D2144|nr:alpha/beta hydrolase fold domain-containing protein [Cryobacterium sp. TMT4-31]TFC85375.1 alpha/beta hydrolase [Cryobacterium sp. TMT4-31]
MDSLTITGPYGAIPIRVYRAAAGSEQSPALVWAHGGGFAWGDLEMPEAHWVSQQLAARGITVISVGYRLAPVSAALTDSEPARDGVLFPVASEEVAAAFCWAADQATAYGIDADRLSLGGASAGGALAAGVALRLRDAGGAQPASLLLAYPLVHSVLPEPSTELAQKIAVLPADARFELDDVRAMNLNYVGDPAGLDNPYAFPGGHDLAGLPPTLVLNSEHDSLRASGQAFAAELALAGVDVTVCQEPGTRHGHLNEPENPGAQSSLRRMTAWLDGSNRG